jgi:hypothetical protein
MTYSAAARGWLNAVKNRAPCTSVRISEAPDMANVLDHKQPLNYVDSCPDTWPPPIGVRVASVFGSVAVSKTLKSPRMTVRH